MSRSILEVNKNNFLKNYFEIKRYVGSDKEIMPIVKANAYGTYLNNDLVLMNKFLIVGVALVDEGVVLRKNGYKNDIFILGQPSIEEIPLIYSNDLIVGVSSLPFLKNVFDSNKKVRCHIEIETGMGRTGVYLDDLDKFCQEILLHKNVIVEGVYTHLSSADCDYNFTNKQINLFRNGVEIVKKYFPNIKYVHCQASNGILNFKLDFCNLVRPGMILYGYESCKTMSKKIKLYPVCKLKSKILFIKKMYPGDCISYGRSYVLEEEKEVATIGIGYADGISRILSNKGFVVINGKKCNIIGNICMDSLMVDISNISGVKIGDYAYIFDNVNVTLENIAFLANTINYEIISRISDRVERVFIS